MFAEQVSVCHLRVSYKRVKKERPTRVSSKSVGEEVSSKNVLQECQARVSYKSVCLIKTCQVRVSSKSVPEESQARLSDKSVK